MEPNESIDLEQFLGKEMLLLKSKRSIVNKASRNFGLEKEEVEASYLTAKSKIRKSAGKRGWTYLLLGLIFLGVGLFGSLSNTGFIFYGAILGGVAFLITAVGLFMLSAKKSV
ncbi:hypothetical protein D3C71_637280 [compost metagenome]